MVFNDFDYMFISMYCYMKLIKLFFSLKKIEYFKNIQNYLKCLKKKYISSAYKKNTYSVSLTFKNAFKNVTNHMFLKPKNT